MDLLEEEILDQLKPYKVTFAKRLRRKTDKGYEKSMSILLSFATNKAPAEVTIGYLKFSTKKYNPPPTRCYQCNHYGHISKHCRSKPTCTKCGSRDHDYDSCSNNKRCINCHGNHSAGYAGCAVYKEEAKIQVLRVQQNLTYREARQRLREISASPSSALLATSNQHASLLEPDVSLVNRNKKYSQAVSGSTRQQHLSQKLGPSLPTRSVPNDANNAEEFEDTTSIPNDHWCNSQGRIKPNYF